MALSGAARTLLDGLADRYAPADLPALLHQCRSWSDTHPLAGVTVIDATPVWHNTTAKHAALLAAGARLTVAAVPPVPHDPAVVRMLRDARVPVLTSPPAPGVGPDIERRPGYRFDVVIDCAGALAHVPSVHGYVELTRSGQSSYQDAEHPVVLVDGGRIKLIETSLGTGDGFVRAMAHLGCGSPAGRRIVVFGSGKVGTGIAMSCADAGASPVVIDFADRHRPDTIGSGTWTRIDVNDRDDVLGAVRQAWCVVTATGRESAVASFAGALTSSGALLANMGVADEFGPDVPADRVLRGKEPLNFALPEPTRMCYMDPVMALSNAAAVELVSGRVPAGLHCPDPALEDRVMEPVWRDGAAAGQIRALWQRTGRGPTAGLR